MSILKTYKISYTNQAGEKKDRLSFGVRVNNNGKWEYKAVVGSEKTLPEKMEAGMNVLVSGFEQINQYKGKFYPYYQLAEPPHLLSEKRSIKGELDIDSLRASKGNKYVRFNLEVKNGDGEISKIYKVVSPAVYIPAYGFNPKHNKVTVTGHIDTFGGNKKTPEFRVTEFIKVQKKKEVSKGMKV